MNYIQITEYDTANGTGIGTVLWLAGCNHNCVKCHNPQTHNPLAGQKFTQQTLDKLIASLNHPYISRLTLSGGDPLFPANRTEVTELCKQIRQRLPDKAIWLYTGYVWEDVADLEVMKYIDILVDGEFVVSQKNLNLKYRGSSNQRLINVANVWRNNSGT